jgi:drug/metabolite transporter (DMT)-like permease
LPPSPLRLVGLTCLAMLAFAGNSLLCRQALKHTNIDAASFTTLRLLSGAVVLVLIAAWRARGATPAKLGRGSWGSALALFIYAAGFSFAYRSLAAGSGALLLFGAVQATMIGHGLWRGERLAAWQWLGLLLALAGLVGLMLPGLAAPPLAGAALMLGAGVAWGVYSLRGRGAGDATQVSAGNFVRAVPVAVLVSALLFEQLSPDSAGAALAVASGALASGVGYAVWYTCLPALRATDAATVQLSVPVIAALGGIVLLGEAATWPMALSACAIMGGIGLVIWNKA